MTKRTFRLTYINARRPIGVAGCEHPPVGARTTRTPPPSAVPRSLTVASRAIHEWNHEPHTKERGGHFPRNVRHILVLRRQLNWNRLTQHRQPVSGCERYRVGVGVIRSELNRDRRYDESDRNTARLAQSPFAEPDRYLELQR